MESVRGDLERAFEFLEEAADLGYSNAEWMLQDTELEPLRKDPRFAILVEQVRENTTRRPR